MGNEVSRADGLSPQAPASARAGSSSKLPTTPVSTPSARRAKSFSSFQSPPLPGTTSSNGTTTPRAAAAALQKQQSIPPNVERTIQRMDKAIRKRVRGGITYNMKIIIRGERGTGKTSLFHRLKGEPIPSEHVATPQLQSATINWNFRANSEESVKCEVWDVVDRGFSPDGPSASSTGATEPPSASPFELGALQSNSNFASVRASAAVAASIASASGASGAHTVATVDASTVDVYHETHGVIFLLDVTKWHTLEYVRQQLERVPAHIPTLVLGNFRDCGNQRKIFKEDIHELLYGSSDRASRQQQQALRRPHELLYFECSLLNCYGLKSLHQYFGIPFLQLKLATIRQQMRIVEGEFAHLKHDVQAKIAEQRYADYVEHIKTTGSDIRTGRKVVSDGPTPATQHIHEPSIVVNGSARTSESDNATPRALAGRTQSSSSDIGVVVAGGDASESDSTTAEALASPASRATRATELEQAPVEIAQKDLEDLPERTHSLADQLTAPLKLEHSASLTAMHDDDDEVHAPQTHATTAAHAATSAKSSGASTSASGKSMASTPSQSAPAADEPMSLEDFQVPKPKTTDLDSFYSDDDSDVDADSDEDVIVPPAAAHLIKKSSHKQQFLYSDSSDDSDTNERATVTARRKPAKSSPRRARGVHAAATTHTGASPPREHAPAPASFAQAVAPSRESEQTPASASPVPPSTPTTRPVSPGARTSRSPSPRHKLESSRAHSPKPPAPAAVSAPTDTPSTIAVAPVDASESASNRVDESHNDGVTASSPESPNRVTSPRRRLQPIKSVGVSEHDASTEERRRDSEATATDASEMVAAAQYPVETVSDGEPESESASVSSPRESERRCDSNGAQEQTSARSGDATATTAAHDVLAYSGNDDGPDQAVAAADDDLDSFLDDDDDDLKDLDDNDDDVKSNGSASLASPTPSSEQPAAKQVLNPTPMRTRPELRLSDDDANKDENDRVATAAAGAVSVCATAPQVASASVSASVVSAPLAPASVSDDDDGPVLSPSPVDDAFFAASDSEQDESSASASVAIAPALAASSAAPTQRHRKMVMSDNDDDSDTSAPRPFATAAAVAVVPPAQAPPPRKPRSGASSSPANELDAFFSESESDGAPAPPLQRKVPMRQALVTSDDDDDGALDRFARYDAKATRKSKAERRQERDELRRMAASLRSSSSRGIDADVAPVASATTLAGSASADVLAAIRAAQEEALRMLPTEPTASVVVDMRGGSSNDSAAVALAPRPHRRSSKSSKTSSSRRQHSESDRENDKDKDDNDATERTRSSSAKKSSSSSSRSKKSKKSSSSKTSSSRRRDRDAAPAMGL